VTAKTRYEWVIRGGHHYHVLTRKERHHPTYKLMLGPLLDGQYRLWFTRGASFQPLHDLIAEPRKPGEWASSDFDRVPTKDLPPVMVRDAFVRADGVATIPDEDLRRTGLEDFLVFEEMLRELPSYPPFKAKRR
jgi:hypothetical protein